MTDPKRKTLPSKRFESKSRVPLLTAENPPARVLRGYRSLSQSDLFNALYLSLADGIVSGGEQSQHPYKFSLGLDWIKKRSLITDHQRQQVPQIIGIIWDWNVIRGLRDKAYLSEGVDRQGCEQGPSLSLCGSSLSHTCISAYKVELTGCSNPGSHSNIDSQLRVPITFLIGLSS